jgi:hypothetical protein
LLSDRHKLTPFENTNDYSTESGATRLPACPC